jgi:hypothetical protein
LGIGSHVLTLNLCSLGFYHLNPSEVSRLSFFYLVSKVKLNSSIQVFSVLLVD